MKNFLIWLIKLAVAIGILYYLFNKATADISFEQLVAREKNWALLGLAAICCGLGVLTCFIRWWLLVRALDLPFSLSHAFRLSFLGYLFNFFSFGVVGGDLMKAFFIARQYPEKKTRAVTTIFVDRIVGLYGLLCLASVSILSFHITPAQTRDVNELARFMSVCHLTVGLTIGGSLGAVLIVLMRRKSIVPIGFTERLPFVGSFVHQLLTAVAIYGRHLKTIGIAFVMSLCVHGLHATGIYLIARAITNDAPSLATHLIIVPIAMVANATPLPGGLGAMELALTLLYRAVSTATTSAQQGFFIALAYRVITMMIAFVGFIYYLSYRREVNELLWKTNSRDLLSAQD